MNLPESEKEIAAMKLVDVMISDLLVENNTEDEKESDQIFLFDKDDLKLHSYKVKIDESEKSKSRIE